LGPHDHNGLHGVKPPQLKPALKDINEIKEFEIISRAALWLPLKFYFFTVARKFYNMSTEQNNSIIRV